MAKKKIRDNQSNDPPPPDFEAGGRLSVTFTDACVDCPLAADVQVRVKVKVSEVAGSKGSVTDALPLVAFAPGQPSLGPPPVAEQLLALAELHVSLVACPESIDVGDADSRRHDGPRDDH
jgi:hypothetical protein